MATQTERAIAWARKKIGTTAYNGMCQSFVADCFYKGAGMTRISAPSAKIACERWRKSTSKSGIPVGAAVYFWSPKSPKNGHVGLHIGNNQLVHAFGSVKCMTITQIEACSYGGKHYRFLGWGWNGGVKPSGAGSTGAVSGTRVDAAVSDAQSGSSQPAVIHIPQVEKVYTKYTSDVPRKALDGYTVTWQSVTTGVAKDITARTGDLTLTDDSAALCMEFAFQVLHPCNHKYFKPLALQCGDLVTVINAGSKEAIFSGQIQTISGSYQETMTVTCHDNGRLLTCNEVIVQFNNVAAKTAITQLAGKLGIQKVSCPNLVSSVYSLEKENAATILQNILATVTAENGVDYFPRMMGDTLVIRSYAKECTQGFYKPASNLAAFDVMKDPSNPQVSWDIGELRNAVLVYSEADNSVSMKATAQDNASIKRYGRRTALETFSDQDTVSANTKAKTTLAKRNRISESYTLETYGSDKIVAGCRVKIDLAEMKGEFWVTAVKHSLGPPHMMSLTLRRAT